MPGSFPIRINMLCNYYITSGVFIPKAIYSVLFLQPFRIVKEDSTGQWRRLSSTTAFPLLF